MWKTTKFLKKQTQKNKMALLVLLPFLLGLIFMTLGKYPISISQLMLIFRGKIFSVDYHLPSVMETVIFEVRLPRILAAIIIGGALAVAGSAYQGIFNNPLISPDILGATAGASLGAAIAILLSWSVLAIQISSFLFGLLAVAATCFISSWVRQSNQILVLVLTGILLGTVFNSLVSLSKFIADPYNKLPAITYWLLGSLSSISSRDVAFLALPNVLAIIPLYFVRWDLNVLSFGDEEAQALGVNTRKIRLIIIFFSTLLTASAVAISGAIGWVGLVVPHLTRLMVGPNYKVLLPASFFVGSSYLLIVDTMARTLFPIEIPLGIITSLVGAPFYIWLLARSRRGWE